MITQRISIISIRRLVRELRQSDSFRPSANPFDTSGVSCRQLASMNRRFLALNSISHDLPQIGAYKTCRAGILRLGYSISQMNKDLKPSDRCGRIRLDKKNCRIRGLTLPPEALEAKDF